MKQETIDRTSKSIRYNRLPLLLAAAALLGLNACATGAKPEAMVVVAPQVEQKPFPKILQHAMCVRTVTGGESTNPLWVSKVDNQAFKTALATSLSGVGLSAPDAGCSYSIDANLLGLSQPVVGFDLTVTSHVNYKVYDNAGQPYLLATVDAPYTANFSDSLIAIERMRLANEGSIRASISQFFDKLRDADSK